MKSLQEKLRKVINITVCLVSLPVPEQGSFLTEVGHGVKRCNTLSEVAAVVVVVVVVVVAVFVSETTVCSCDKKIDFLNVFVFSHYWFCGLSMHI